MVELSQSQPCADKGPTALLAPRRRSVETSKRVEFHVVNALGTTLMTSDSQDLARSWVRRHLWQLPSLRVVKVTQTLERETVYRPAIRQERSAA